MKPAFLVNQIWRYTCTTTTLSLLHITGSQNHTGVHDPAPGNKHGNGKDVCPFLTAVSKYKRGAEFMCSLQ